MTQDRAQLLITAVDQTRSAFDSIRGNLAKLGTSRTGSRGCWLDLASRFRSPVLPP